jgi:hypothetical protein
VLYERGHRFAVPGAKAPRHSGDGIQSVFLPRNLDLLVIDVLSGAAVD